MKKKDSCILRTVNLIDYRNNLTQNQRLFLLKIRRRLQTQNGTVLSGSPLSAQMISCVIISVGTLVVVFATQ